MAVELPEEFQDAKESEKLFVVEIYDVFLRIGELHITNTNVDIEFEGNKYLAIPVTREEISQSVEETDNSMKFEMTDATMGQLKYIIEGFDFRGCNVRVRQILYPDSLKDNSIYRDVFMGYIDNPVYENGTFSFTLRSRIPKVTAPRRTYQAACNCKFGDSVCQKDLETTTGTVASSSGNDITLNIDAKDGDYWKDGTISIGGETRMIITSFDSTVRVYYPFFAAVESGDEFTLKRGCDKTQQTCKNRFDNLQHYSGFPAIPFELFYK